MTNDIKTKKNLIIGAVVKYSWSKIRNFFISLKKVKIENCDFVMFVGNMNNEIINNIKSFGITIHNIPDKFLKTKKKIHNYRFKLYKDFLLINKNKYNMVFTADIRDTIFQKDIFKYYNAYKKPFIGLFLEDNIIKNQIYNKIWVNYFCPKANIWNKTIICSGTIIGTVDKFIEFCDILWKYVVKWKDYNNMREQGIVNCLIYNRKIMNNYIIKSDNHGPVMTIGISKRENIHFDKDYNILNYDNQIAAVIHQYDRKLDLANLINKKFNDENNFLHALINIIKIITKFRINIIYIIIFLIFYFLYKIIIKKQIIYNLKLKLKKLN